MSRKCKERHHHPGFGPLIRSLRKKSYPDVSIAQYVKSIDIQGPYQTQIETGTCPPPASRVVVALAQSLGVDANDLLAVAGHGENNDRERDKAFGRLIRNLESLENEKFAVRIHDIDLDEKGDAIPPTVTLRFHGIYAKGTNLKNPSYFGYYIGDKICPDEWILLYDYEDDKGELFGSDLEWKPVSFHASDKIVYREGIPIFRDVILCEGEASWLIACLIAINRGVSK